MHGSTPYLTHLLKEEESRLDPTCLFSFDGGLRVQTYRRQRSTLDGSDEGLLRLSSDSPSFPRPSAQQGAARELECAVPSAALTGPEDFEARRGGELGTARKAGLPPLDWRRGCGVPPRKRGKHWLENAGNWAESLAAPSGFSAPSPLPSQHQTRLSSLASRSLSSLRGISQVRSKALEELANLRSCFDLLLFLPLQYAQLQTRTAVPRGSLNFSHENREAGTPPAVRRKERDEELDGSTGHGDNSAQTTRQGKPVRFSLHASQDPCRRSDAITARDGQAEASDDNSSLWTLPSGDRFDETPGVEALPALGPSVRDFPRTAVDEGDDASLKQGLIPEPFRPPLSPSRCHREGEGAVLEPQEPAVSTPPSSFPGEQRRQEDGGEPGCRDAGWRATRDKPAENLTENEKEQNTPTSLLEEQQRELRQQLEKSLSRYLALQEDAEAGGSSPLGRGRKRRQKGAAAEQARDEADFAARDVAFVGCIEKIGHCKLRSVRRGKPLMISTAVVRDVFFTPFLSIQNEENMKESGHEGPGHEPEDKTQEAQRSARAFLSRGTGDAEAAKTKRRKKTKGEQQEQRPTGERRREDQEGLIHVTWFDKFLQLVKLKRRHVVCLVGKAVRAKTGRMKMQNPRVHFLAPSEEAFLAAAAKEGLPAFLGAPGLAGAEQNAIRHSGDEDACKRDERLTNERGAESASPFNMRSASASRGQPSVDHSSPVSSFSSASPSSSTLSLPREDSPPHPTCVWGATEDQAFSLPTGSAPQGTPGAPTGVRFLPTEESIEERGNSADDKGCVWNPGAGCDDRRVRSAGPEMKTQTNPDTYHLHKLMPIYPSISGVPAKVLRAGIETLLRENSFAEVVPEFLRRKRGIERLDATLRALHYPQTPADIRKAKRDFFYSTMLWLQLAKKLRTREVESQFRGYASRAGEEILRAFYASLEFPLTPSQLQAIEEIRADMESPRPMRRLLQGDVGSGKTAVAAVALLLSASAGHQAALLAPTAALARQHQINLQKFLGPLGFHVHLLVSDAPDKDATIRLINTGNAEITVGTHALLQDYVLFPRLGLVVIDEQHKFGVNQRWKLLLKRRRRGAAGGGGNLECLELERTEAAAAAREAGEEQRKWKPSAAADGEPRNGGHREAPQEWENASSTEEQAHAIAEVERDQRTADATWSGGEGQEAAEGEETHDFEKDGKRRLEHEGSDVPGAEEGGRMADVLLMTATPIPRTQVLLRYGDLKLSKLLAAEIRYSPGPEKRAGEGKLEGDTAHAAFRGTPCRQVGDRGRAKRSGAEPLRRAVATYLIDKRSEGEVGEMMKIIQDEISKTRQVFWICPLVDGERRREKAGRGRKRRSLGSQETGDGQTAENEARRNTRDEEEAGRDGGGVERGDRKDQSDGETGNKPELVQGQGSCKESAAVQRFEELRKLLPEIRIRLLHGRMRAEEKEEVLSELRGGTVDLLVATTVVEVGIDIPNASVIVIDSAERFGLTQLHQLRGRVGRDARHPSFCFIILDPLNKNLDEKAMHRFAAIAATTDGFQLAETDAQLRGGGTLFGQQQHGQSDLWMIRGLKRSEQARLLEEATEDADHIVKLLDDDATNSRCAVGQGVGRKHVVYSSEGAGERHHFRFVHGTSQSLEANKTDRKRSTNVFRGKREGNEDAPVASLGVIPRKPDKVETSSNPHCFFNPSVKDANKTGRLLEDTTVKCENEKGNAGDSSSSEHAAAYQEEKEERGILHGNGYNPSEKHEWGHSFNQSTTGKNPESGSLEFNLWREAKGGEEKSFSAEANIREARQLVEEVRLLIPPNKIDWLFRV
ncbi:putative ATP-dependent DNA helicase [Neospora caninum Liverpool]|uniref:Putative ATP-dependent DNA helicase n=1 Tax=Neospora caninum (strain Liverpool) TaxID=572307 RepID=F0V809_NEOCL|nr:putative ATP-dependent DNA helicase [Neospora caninum Liverpool]CBZ49850.1 putative ATP-dependent DNA helicase [Neospora caninum Liverpool]|eukprot:XP_003879885.1 putative ATP-dependent DNA helicase [Neospora caninum Liverpool]